MPDSAPLLTESCHGKIRLAGKGVVAQARPQSGTRNASPVQAADVRRFRPAIVPLATGREVAASKSFRVP